MKKIILNKTDKIRLNWEINMESVKKKLGTPLIFIELIYVSIHYLISIVNIVVIQNQDSVIRMRHFL